MFGYYSIRLVSNILLGGMLIVFAVLLPSCKAPEQKADIYEQIQKRGYLKVGTTFTAPPQGFLDNNGIPQGYDIELIHLLAKEILGDEKAVKLVEVQNATRLSMLNTHQVDFVLGTFSITEARKPYFNFSEPYLISRFQILVKDDSGLKSVKDLSDKKVCFLFGGTSEGILKKNVPATAQLIGFNSVADEMQAFRRGAIDGLAQQSGVLVTYMHENCGVRLLPEVLEEAKYGVGFEKSNYSSKIQKVVQEKLNKLEAAGELDKLEAKWLSVPLTTKCTPGRQKYTQRKAFDPLMLQLQ